VSSSSGFSCLTRVSFFIPLVAAIRIVYIIVQSLMVIVSECAADPSDAVNGPTVSDDPKEEQVVEVIEEGTTKHNEGEMPHWSGGDSLHFVSLSLSLSPNFLIS
jgi:hypothetical protein